MVVFPPASDVDRRIDWASLAAALWRRRLRIVLVTALACAAAWLFLTTVTPVYQARAGIVVEARDDATAGQAATSAGADDASIETQVRLVRSRQTLLAAIEAEALRDVAELNRPGTGPLATAFGLVGLADAPAAGSSGDEALIAEMLDRLTVERIGDSRLISIGFAAEDPALAARLANAIAAAHVAGHAGLPVAAASDATAWLEREIADMRGRVSEAEARVASYRAENGVLETTGNSSLLARQMSDVTARVSAAAERRAAAEARSRLIGGLLDAGEPVETIAELRESPVIQQLAEQKAGLRAQRAGRAATLLAGHPEIRDLDARIAELTAEIQAEGRRVARALESRARIELELERSLRDELAGLEMQAASSEAGGGSLAELERQAAAQRDLLNAFLVRYREAVASIGADVTPPGMRVASAAAEPGQPVYPRKGPLVAAVAMAALLLQSGGVVLGAVAGGTVFVPRVRRRSEAAAVDDKVEEVQGHDEGEEFEAVGQTGAAPAVKRSGEADVFPGPMPEAEPAAAGDWQPDARGQAAVAPALAPSRDEPELIIERVLAESRPRSIAEGDTISEPRPDTGPPATDAGPAIDEPAMAEVHDQPAAPEFTADPVESDPVEAEVAEPARFAVTEIPEAETVALAEAPEPGPAADRHRPESGPIAKLAALVADGARDAGANDPDPGDPDPGDPGRDDSDRLFADGEFPGAFAGETDMPQPDAFETAADESGEEARSDVVWDEVARTEPDAAAEPAIEPAAEPPAGPAAVRAPESGMPRDSRFGKSIPYIAMHIAANADRLSVVASADDSREDRVVAGKIALDLTRRGLGVVLVDAGGAGGERDGAGITDLADGVADFGDVVHGVDSEGLYHVPWGRRDELDITSPRVEMLLEALAELHDHILVMCGPMGEGSAMPWFARTGAGLILASKSEATVEQVARLSNTARQTGFAHVSLARADSLSSEVA